MNNEALDTPEEVTPTLTLLHTPSLEPAYLLHSACQASLSSLFLPFPPSTPAPSPSTTPSSIFFS
jgi:hypothetical protein